MIYTKTRVLLVQIIFLCAFASTLSSGCSGALHPCFIEEQYGYKEKKDNPIYELNFFFDRTDSVGGFVGPVGDPTDYSRALDAVLTEADELWPDKSRFHEFGSVSGIYEILYSTKDIKTEVRKRDFYARGAYNEKGVYVLADNYHPEKDKARVQRFPGSAHPFTAVREYIKQQENPRQTINFVVSDLYEQDGFYESFYQIFKYAFEKDLGASLFAVRSRYKGHISDFSPDPTKGDEKDDAIDVDGDSTIFFFIIGPDRQLQEFANKIALRFEAINLVHFDKTLFLLNAGFRDNSLNSGRKLFASRIASGKKLFYNLLQSKNMINLDKKQVSKYLQKWRVVASPKDKKKTEYKGVQVQNVEAYRLMQKIGARYVYISPRSAEYYEAKALPGIHNFSVDWWLSSKTVPGQKSKEFKASGDIKGPTIKSDKNYNYLMIDIGSSVLKQPQKGVYRVRFTVVPDWVLALNADSVDHLRSSLKNERIKTLNLRFIYEKILDEFTAKGGKSAEFYLVKNK